LCPLPKLHERAPVNIHDPSLGHRGVDLAYARTRPHDLVLQYPPDTEHGTVEHFMPRWVPVFAVHDGSITYAGPLGAAWSVVIDHDNGWASQYGNLEHLFVTPTSRSMHRARARAGDVLGYVGAARPGMFKSLHFELWTGDDARGFQDIDPMRHISKVLPLPWADPGPN